MKILPVSVRNAKESDSSFFIELYNIYLKTGVIHICNTDVEITFNDIVYYPVPIQRGNVKTTVDSKIDNMDLKISDADNSKVSALMNGFDFRGRIVEIFRIQYPESLEDSDIIIPIFRGKLDAPSYSNGEFTCIVKSAFPKNHIPMRTTQYFCNNTFGDSLCKKNKKILNCKITRIISENKVEIQLDDNSQSISTNEYENGLITVGYETKLISSNTTNTITTKYPFIYEMQINDKATISLNCNKTPEMCAKYNNRENYGGFLAIPKEFRILS